MRDLLARIIVDRLNLKLTFSIKVYKQTKIVNLCNF